MVITLRHALFVLVIGAAAAQAQAMSASGARYANSGETFVFWNEGNTAFIEESGKPTYQGCTTRR